MSCVIVRPWLMERGVDGSACVWGVVRANVGDVVVGAMMFGWWGIEVRVLVVILYGSKGVGGY
jgi:hypothetical protein